MVVTMDKLLVSNIRRLSLNGRKCTSFERHDWLAAKLKISLGKLIERAIKAYPA